MDASRPSRTDGLAGPQKASPAWVERLAPLDLVVVAVVLDHLAPVVEAQHHHARVGEFLAFPVQLAHHSMLESPYRWSRIWARNLRKAPRSVGSAAAVPVGFWDVNTKAVPSRMMTAVSTRKRLPGGQ